MMKMEGTIRERPNYFFSGEFFCIKISCFRVDKGNRASLHSEKNSLWS